MQHATESVRDQHEKTSKYKGFVKESFIVSYKCNLCPSFSLFRPHYGENINLFFVMKLGTKPKPCQPQAFWSCTTHAVYKDNSSRFTTKAGPFFPLAGYS